MYQNTLTYKTNGHGVYAGLGENGKLRIGEAYRNLQFLKPTTGDLNTWLEANAVKMPLTGTWVFNSTISVSSSTSFHISFSCDGIEYTDMTYNPTKTFCYQDADGSFVSAYDGSWADSSYRTITFTQPVKYEGNEEFVRWFVDNAAPQQ